MLRQSQRIVLAECSDLLQSFEAVLSPHTEGAFSRLLQPIDLSRAEIESSIWQLNIPLGQGDKRPPLKRILYKIMTI